MLFHQHATVPRVSTKNGDRLRIENGSFKLNKDSSNNKWKERSSCRIACHPTWPHHFMSSYFLSSFGRM